MYDYEDRAGLTRYNQILETCEFTLTILFTVECIAKVIAHGFILHDKSYLRDGWNAIDFFVVVIGLVEFIPAIPSSNLKALRTIRVMRPLRSINKLPGLKR